MSITSNEQVFELMKSHKIDISDLPFTIQYLQLDYGKGLVAMGIDEDSWVTKVLIRRDQVKSTEVSPFMIDWSVSGQEYYEWLRINKPVTLTVGQLERIQMSIDAAIDAEVQISDSGDQGRYDPEDSEWFVNLKESSQFITELR
ncbi:conserved hypothetical protein [Vibrio phage 150E35-1]|nr:conserved hypothetical protein [Vibrio phage 150E35-1]